jgi:hypothetical protein
MTHMTISNCVTLKSKLQPMILLKQHRYSSPPSVFFETGKRWQKVKIPSSGFYVGVTAKIVGRTSDTNFLALRVLDLSYLPRSSSTTTSTPSSTSTPTSKRSSRWDGRVDSSTPSKRMRKSDSIAGSSNRLEKNSTIIADPHTPPTVENNEADLQLPATITEHLNETASTRHASPSTSVDLGVSSLSSIPSQLSESGGRLQQNRQSPINLD